MYTPTKEWKLEKVLACNRCHGLLATDDLTSHLCDTSAKEYDAKRIVRAVKLYQCDLCHARMQQSGNIRSHRRRHLQEKIHVCPDQIPSLHSSGLTTCGKRFADPTALVRHRKVKHGYVPGCGRLGRAIRPTKSSHFSPYPGSPRSGCMVKLEDEDKPGMLVPLALDASTPSSIPSLPRAFSGNPCEVKTAPKSPNPGPVLSIHERTHSPCSSHSSSTTHPPSHNLSYYNTSICGPPFQFTQLDLDQILLNPPLFEELSEGCGFPSATPDDFSMTKQPLINFCELFDSNTSLPLSSMDSSSLSSYDWSSDSSSAGSPFYSTSDYDGDDYSYPSPPSDATSPSPSLSPSSTFSDSSSFPFLSSTSEFLFS